MPVAPGSDGCRGNRSIERTRSAMSWARGSFGLASIDWSAVRMQAVRLKADKNRTSVPANSERRRESGWTTLNKIRLPNAVLNRKLNWKKGARLSVVRTLNNLRHDYVFATK